MPSSQPLAARERPAGPLSHVDRAAVAPASAEETLAFVAKRLGAAAHVLERAFACGRLRTLFNARWTMGRLLSFHTAHKLLLLAHSTDAYRELGRLVAGARAMTRRELEERYAEGFMRAFEQRATARRHTNVLQHMAGYFKDRLDPASKREMADAIEDYRRGLVPIAVPLTVVRHYVRVLDVTYLAGQRYLEPHPEELLLAAIDRCGSERPRYLDAPSATRSETPT